MRRSRSVGPAMDQPSGGSPQQTSPKRRLRAYAISEAEDEVRRNNLIAVLRLAIKSLIDLSCVGELEENSPEILNFISILEAILEYKFIFNRGNTPWKFICAVFDSAKRRLKKADKSTETTLSSMYTSPVTPLLLSNNNLASVHALGLRSDLARMRAWLRLCLMEKVLAEYFECLINSPPSLLARFYSESSFFHSSQTQQVQVDLMGLSALDLTFYLKHSFEDAIRVIDYTPYLRFVQCETSVLQDALEKQEARARLLIQVRERKHREKMTLECRDNAIRVSESESSLFASSPLATESSSQAASDLEYNYTNGEDSALSDNGHRTLVNDRYGDEDMGGEVCDVELPEDNLFQKHSATCNNNLNTLSASVLSSMVAMNMHESSASKLKAVQEQKSYLEELVRMRDQQLIEAKVSEELLRQTLDGVKRQYAEEKNDLENAVLELQGIVTGLTLKIHSLESKLEKQEQVMKTVPSLKITSTSSLPQNIPATRHGDNQMVTMEVPQFDDSNQSSPAN